MGQKMDVRLHYSAQTDHTGIGGALVGQCSKLVVLQSNLFSINHNKIPGANFMKKIDLAFNARALGSLRQKDCG